MLAWVPALLGAVGSGITSFFGFKKEQADTVQEALKVLGEAQDADSAYAMAASNSIRELYESGPGVERLWRPVFMWVILGLVVSRWFGFIPPGITQEEVIHIYNFLEIGLIGYIPLRSVDKWMKGFQIGNILKEFVKKKVM